VTVSELVRQPLVYEIAAPGMRRLQEQARDGPLGAQGSAVWRQVADARDYAASGSWDARMALAQASINLGCSLGPVDPLGARAHFIEARELLQACFVDPPAPDCAATVRSWIAARMA
jgi:hypothetical protein